VCLTVVVTPPAELPCPLQTWGGGILPDCATMGEGMVSVVTQAASAAGVTPLEPFAETSCVTDYDPGQGVYPSVQVGGACRGLRDECSPQSCTCGRHAVADWSAPAAVREGGLRGD
jgi:hypothetical protein